MGTLERPRGDEGSLQKGIRGGGLGGRGRGHCWVPDGQGMMGRHRHRHRDRDRERWKMRRVLSI